MSSMNPKLEAVYQVSYLNLINHIMLDLKIPQTINEIVPCDDQCKVTPGEMIQLIVLDILTGRQALVHLEEWACHIDIKKLISPDVEASYFNDDAIARHLDRIDEANVHQVFSELTLQLWKKEGDTLRIFHGDTTFWSFLPNLTNMRKKSPTSLGGEMNCALFGITLTGMLRTKFFSESTGK
jgi:hypothetical protein